MTTTVGPSPDAGWSAATPGDRPARVLLADRGDPLVRALSAALRERFDVIGQLDTELTRTERLLVAASTIGPSRPAWAERFYKSNLGVVLRSRRAGRGLADLHLAAGPAAGPAADVIFQTHALFEVAEPRTVMYIDCTHRQSMAGWPAWNPLRGRALDRWLVRERRQYQQSAHVFAFSEPTARSIVEEYDVPAERVSVVGAGVNFERLPELDRARHDRVATAASAGPRRPPTILFVGNDFDRKGGRELLAAFAVLRRRVPQARLRIVGTPHRIPPQAGVEQVGRVHSREQMSRLYAGADVFCLPSHYDPFPGALLEAMAHGLPSVVTATCGIPEMVVPDDTAVVVGRGESMTAELADGLAQVLTDPDRAARMGRSARQRVEERFLWSHVVDRMSPVLDRLAAAPPSTAC